MRIWRNDSKPHIIQSDDVTEFKKYDTIAYYKENNIKHIFSLTYSPESISLIRNF